MSKPVIIESSEQTVARSTPAKVFSICFNNQTEGAESKVRLLDGGSAGTAVFDLDITDGSEIGENIFSHNWNDEGADFTDGLYVEITGTLTVNLEYKDLSVG